jgi:hypothetical protein
MDIKNTILDDIWPKQCLVWKSLKDEERLPQKTLNWTPTG